jgi:MSHA pilin protein MshD
MNPILFEKVEMRISERGISLIELIMFIMIVSVALAGILLVMNVTTRGSADPLVHKQALAIAESLLEEVELMPFTYCDPNDVNAASAVNAASCSASMDQDKGGAALTTPTPNSETRYSNNNPLDNVADYGGFNMVAGSIMDITNTNIGLAGYRANIVVARNAWAGIPADAALRITVTVTGPDNLPVVVEGIRTRYSPIGVP